jgi:DNA-binding response OmpR family regulator
MADIPNCGPLDASSDARVVLVVNDDPFLRDLVAGMLTEAGYVVLTAGDREEALALARVLNSRLALVVVGGASS